MRRRPPAALLALAAALLVLAVAAVAVFVPYLTRDREAVAGVPVPPPFSVQENIPLRPGEEVCLDSVAIDASAEIAEFGVASETKSGQPLRVSATAPGYRSSSRVSGGYASPMTLRVPLEPPSQSLLAEFCVANRGKRKVDLLAAHEPRTASRPVASVDGQVVAPDMALRFLEDGSGNVVDRIGSLVDRMAAFHPPVLEKPVLWLVLALLVLALPAGAIYAVVASFSAED
jgi:hypothetical protein